jgi:DNA-binding transcriptional regulator GbsR (MarR family)
MRIIVRERKLREFDPTVQMLASTIAEPSFSAEPLDRQRRIRETHSLMHSLGSWTDEMLQLEPSTLSKLLKLGNKIQKFFVTATGKK